MVVCTFAGHREVYQSGIDADIQAAIERILETDTAFQFLTGGMGDFDGKCAGAVRAAKRTHPNLDIQLALVLPYMTNRLNTDKLYYEHCYDTVIIPEELAGVHYKAAIGRRNRWLVDCADWVIAFVYRDFGGAVKAVQYALQQGKKVINLAKNPQSHI